jgi:hypothetical protein
VNQQTAGLLYNLGIVGNNLNDNPDNAGDGARAFAGGDGNNYNLQDARPIADIARGLQGFVQLKSLNANPLSNDGVGT